jgi:signal transduction histidine kinase
MTGATMGGIADRFFPFRNLATWLGLLVVLVAVVALLLNAVLVLPSLTRDLEQEQLTNLARSAESSRARFVIDFSRAQRGTGGRTNPATVVAEYGDVIGANVTVFQASLPTRLLPVAGSGAARDNPIAVAAATEVGLQAGIVGEDATRKATVAYPFAVDGMPYVALIESGLQDVDRAVALTRQRSELGAALGLVIAVAVGAIGAALLTQRIKRLEQGARRIAAGDLSGSIDLPGRDELADLGTALERMRAELARTDAARRAFIANASHELRTPVFALAGYLELIEDEQPDPDTLTEFLDSMRDQVGRLTHLATDLLDLSRLDADTVAVAQEPVQLGEVATVLVRDMLPLAGRRQATLIAEADPALALGDNARVQQITRVLIDNALRHNPPGVTITVRSEAGDGSPRLIVADDGPPITEADAERVFERFSRGSGAGEGSGLGLAIAAELATRMGGSLTLDQAPPGKRFVLALPRDPQAIPVEA